MPEGAGVHLGVPAASAYFFCDPMKRLMNALALHLSVLDDLLERRLPSAERSLLAEIREAIARLPESTRPWVRLFKEACERVRQERSLLTEEERRAVASQGCGLLAVLTLPELIRGVLLMGAAHRLPEADLAGLIESRWSKGSVEERIALLRWLAHLPAPERWLSFALECAERGEDREFEALACENPYPAQHFPMSSLTALLQRVMAMALSLRRVEGLSLRLALEQGGCAAGPGANVTADLTNVLPEPPVLPRD